MLRRFGRSLPTITPQISPTAFRYSVSRRFPSAPSHPGGTVSVVRRIGRWRAAWMMLDGGDVGAAQARAWGLVDEVVDP